MYWILAAIFLSVALAVPRLRPLGMLGCVILGVMLTWAVVQRMRDNDPARTPSVQERGRPVSPATSLDAIPLTSVDVDRLQLTGGGAPFELRGRVTNKSQDALIRSITLRVTRRDCYEGALDPTGCTLLWQEDRQWIAVTVPPRQSRDFASSIWMHGSSGRPRGTVQDSFEVVAVAGEAMTAEQIQKQSATTDEESAEVEREQ